MAEKINPWVVGVIVLVLAYVAFSQGWIGNFGGDNDNGGSGTTVITAATTETIAGSDAMNPGTVVSGTTSVSVNGGTFVTDDFSVSTSPGEALEILVVNNTAYHNAVLTKTVPNAVTDRIDAKLYKNATVTITVYDQFTSLDASGASSNATMASGESKNLDVYLQGTTEQSTQDMVCVVETSDNTKVEEVILAGAGATKTTRGKPSSYTLLGTSSSVWVYDMAPIDSSAKKSYTLTIKSKAGQDASSTQFKVACLTKEHFLDSRTGKLAYDIEDSSGTLKSMASYSFVDTFN